MRRIFFFENRNFRESISSNISDHDLQTLWNYLNSMQTIWYIFKCDNIGNIQIAYLIAIKSEREEETRTNISMGDRDPGSLSLITQNTRLSRPVIGRALTNMFSKCTQTPPATHAGRFYRSYTSSSIIIQHIRWRRLLMMANADQSDAIRHPPSDGPRSQLHERADKLLSSCLSSPWNY